MFNIFVEGMLIKAGLTLNVIFQLLKKSMFCSIVIIVLQISRLSEGSTGQIFATSSVIYQMKMLGL